MLDPEACERARLSRDPRFDGRFFIGVVTTGVYCRPICPVQPPRAENVRYFPSAAAAAESGLRPCLRCRPESSPGTPAWSGTSATVSRALRLIAEGALDEGTVAGLSSRLGIGPRHLSRLFHRHLGASPLAVAKTRRLHFAKKLIDETDLSMADVAFSAGFGSVRRFNDVVRDTYGRSPTQLRRRGTRRPQGDAPCDDALVLRLSYRPPFDWDALLSFLASRAIPGVEVVHGRCYRRVIRWGDSRGTLAVRPLEGSPTRKNELELRLRFPDPHALSAIVERVRRMFDLGADPEEISTHLARDPGLAPWVRARPGLRLPGAWDGFELAVRGILGQQVTVRGASTLAGRLVQAFGEPFGEPFGKPLTPGPPCGDERRAGEASPGDETPGWLFPAPEVLATAELTRIGLPGARAAAITHLARAVAEGDLRFDGSVDWETVVERLVALPGVGDWTAQYVAMRALGVPDAFPATDLGLLRAAGNGGKPLTGHRLRKRAESWRPWRAYAALYLWQKLGAAPTRRNEGRRTA